MGSRTKLQGKLVVITGASSGIGRACAFAFAHEGTRLILAARSEFSLKALEKEIRSLGAEAHFQI